MYTSLTLRTGPFTFSQLKSVHAGHLLCSWWLHRHHHHHYKYSDYYYYNTNMALGVVFKSTQWKTTFTSQLSPQDTTPIYSHKSQKYTNKQHTKTTPLSPNCHGWPSVKKILSPSFPSLASVVGYTILLNNKRDNNSLKKEMQPRFLGLLINVSHPDLHDPFLSNILWNQTNHHTDVLTIVFQHRINMFNNKNSFIFLVPEN